MNSIVCPKPLQYLIVICASVLLFIWGLPHTIALRNIMMGIGAVASLYFLFKYKPFVLDWNAVPLILIYCLPVWALIHYYFFAQEPDLQWPEIKSLWVRVVAGMLIATAMGVLIRKPDCINSLFIFGFFGVSISVVLAYIYYSWEVGGLVTPREFPGTYLFNRNKGSAAFFSSIDLGIGCAYLSYIYFNNDVKNRIFKSTTMLFLMIISISVSVMTNSKNGIGIGLILLTIFMVIVFIYLIRNISSKNITFGLFLIGVMVFLCSAVIVMHKNTTVPKWGNVFLDIQTAVDIDRYQRWRGPIASNGEPFPKNSLGEPVTENVYERYSWIAAGSRVILNHSLGYGLINNPSFPRWLKKDGITFDGEGATHSGWVDLGLAFGVPAIVIVFLSLSLVIGGSILRSSYHAYLSGWITLTVFLSILIQEITYKHTFEAMIFFITFGGACITSMDGCFFGSRVLARLNK